MTVISLALCLATHPCPLPVVKEWYSRCIVSLAFPGADLRSDKIIRLLRGLTHDQILEQYTNSFFERKIEARMNAYIVSLARREDNSFLKECSHPCSGPGSDFYLVLDNSDTGSISGFVRLPETFRHRIDRLARIAGLAGMTVPVVLPGDVLSPHHLEEIVRAKIQFVLPITPSRVIRNEHLKIILRSVPNELNYRSFHNEPVYIRNCTVDAGGTACPGFLIMNQRAEQTARLRLRREMYRITENLKHAVVSGDTTPDEMLSDIAGDLSHLFSFRSEDKRVGPAVDHASVARAMTDAGTLLVLNNSPLRKETCLSLISKRRSFNETLSDRSREFYRMIGPEMIGQAEEGIFFIGALASAIRWRLEFLLPDINSKAGISVDALMTSLSPVLMKVGPGRRRRTEGLLSSHHAILTTLSSLPEQLVPGCTPGVCTPES
ncbi:MAG: hypothetical protein LUQ25_00645 [Methanoregulaceae archaeon]|nr:hypothetical protein [Methanoregulaceae archaeon]